MKGNQLISTLISGVFAILSWTALFTESEVKKEEVKKEIQAVPFNHVTYEDQVRERTPGGSEAVNEHDEEVMGTRTVDEPPFARMTERAPFGVMKALPMMFCEEMDCGMLIPMRCEPVGTTRPKEEMA